MSSTFEDTKITAFQPKQEKDKETKETLSKMVFKGQARLNNTLQISDLFASFRKRLVKVRLSPHESFESDISFDNVTIEDFTVKNKMESIGSGKDAEKIPVEFVFFTMAVKMDEDGNFLKDMYSIFQLSVKMDIDFVE